LERPGCRSKTVRKTSSAAARRLGNASRRRQTRRHRGHRVASADACVSAERGSVRVHVLCSCGHLQDSAHPIRSLSNRRGPRFAERRNAYVLLLVDAHQPARYGRVTPRRARAFMRGGWLGCARDGSSLAGCAGACGTPSKSGTSAFFPRINRTNGATVSSKTIKGKCQRCGKSPRVLARTIKAGFVCRKCLDEVRKPKRLFATLENVEYLRKMGFDVPEDLTKKEWRRLLDLDFVRCYGKRIVPYDTPAEELRRLAGILRLRERGVAIDESATEAEIQAIETRLGELRHFFTKVVGVTFANRDGTKRQHVFSRCRRFERLLVAREEDNPVDPNAVWVRRLNGEQLGYLERQLAAEIAPRLRRGWQYAALIKAIVGGEPSAPTLGVVIALIVAAPHVTESRIGEYINRVIFAIQAEEEGSACVLEDHRAMHPWMLTGIRGVPKIKKRSGCLVVMVLIALAVLGGAFAVLRSSREWTLSAAVGAGLLSRPKAVGARPPLR